MTSLTCTFLYMTKSKAHDLTVYKNNDTNVCRASFALGYKGTKGGVAAKTVCRPTQTFS